MSENYLSSIIHTIRKVFALPQKNASSISKLWKRANSGTTSADQILDEFVKLLETLQVMPTDQSKSSYKSTSMIELLGDYRPKSILDIGAGSGIILQSIGQEYDLPKSKMFGVELKEINNSNITPLRYTSDMSIPLPDKSIDVVIMMSVLHHIPPEYRSKTLSEVQRIASDDCRIIIREHDGDGTPEFWMFLQFVHYVWYVAYNENYDPLFLMSKSELIDTLGEYGFTRIGEKNTIHRNPQKIYEIMFTRQS